MMTGKFFLKGLIYNAFALELNNVAVLDKKSYYKPNNADQKSKL